LIHRNHPGRRRPVQAKNKIGYAYKEVQVRRQFDGKAMNLIPVVCHDERSAFAKFGEQVLSLDAMRWRQCAVWLHAVAEPHNLPAMFRGGALIKNTGRAGLQDNRRQSNDRLPPQAVDLLTGHAARSKACAHVRIVRIETDVQNFNAEPLRRDYVTSLVLCNRQIGVFREHGSTTSPTPR
jgi:hypothetical protein